MPRKRKEPDEDAEDEGSTSQSSSQQSSSPLSAEETDKLANELCRYVLLREHTKKPITRAEAKTAVIKDRKDPGGKIMKALLHRANEKLLEIAGIEVVPAVDKDADDEDDGAESSQGGGASQSSQAGGSQGGSQGALAKAAAGARYVLVNRLENRVPAGDSKQAAEYQALVQVVLGLLAHGEGVLEEDALLDHWLGTKLRAPRDFKMPNQRLSVADLVTKTMVAEAFLRKTRAKGGDKVAYTAGPRASLSRDMSASDAWDAGLSS